MEQHMKPEDMTDKQLEQLEDSETSEEVAELGDEQLDGIAGGKRGRRRRPRKPVKGETVGRRHERRQEVRARSRDRVRHHRCPDAGWLHV